MSPLPTRTEAQGCVGVPSDAAVLRRAICVVKRCGRVPASFVHQPNPDLLALHLAGFELAQRVEPCEQGQRKRSGFAAARFCLRDQIVAGKGDRKACGLNIVARAA